MNTRLTSADLVHLKGISQLRSLSLAETDIDGKSLEYLRSLTGLKYLDLTGTFVTASNERAVRQALPHTTVTW